MGGVCTCLLWGKLNFLLKEIIKIFEEVIELGIFVLKLAYTLVFFRPNEALTKVKFFLTSFIDWTNK